MIIRSLIPKFYLNPGVKGSVGMFVVSLEVDKPPTISGTSDMEKDERIRFDIIENDLHNECLMIAFVHDNVSKCFVHDLFIFTAIYLINHQK